MAPYIHSTALSFFAGRHKPGTPKHHSYDIFCPGIGQTDIDAASPCPDLIRTGVPRRLVR
jgi:hypothetical protein